MDVQHLKPIAEYGDKSIQILAQQRGVSYIKAESKQALARQLIQLVNVVHRLIRVGTYRLGQLAAIAGEHVFQTAGYFVLAQCGYERAVQAHVFGIFKLWIFHYYARMNHQIAAAHIVAQHNGLLYCFQHIRIGGFIVYPARERRMSLYKLYRILLCRILIRLYGCAHFLIGLIEKAAALVIVYGLTAKAVIEVEIHAVKASLSDHAKALVYSLYAQYAGRLYRNKHIQHSSHAAILEYVTRFCIASLHRAHCVSAHLRSGFPDSIQRQSVCLF